ncbi:MAG: hypothetical protein U1A23_00760 [Candidatus Sungbacteria bacterium]|nr:hypothetical protein [bacterium]MDZ4285438.1 hypothetical protein [Candidatus Sungbacteria bacterium]
MRKHMRYLLSICAIAALLIVIGCESDNAPSSSVSSSASPASGLAGKQVAERTAVEQKVWPPLPQNGQEVDLVDEDDPHSIYKCNLGINFFNVFT